MDLKGRDFLKLLDFTTEEITYLVDLAAELKEKKKKGILVDGLRGKNVALIFEKTSTRTRCSFEVAAHDLGMGTTYLDPSSSQIGKKESIADTARVLASMYDGIEYRGYGQDIVEELAKYSKVPVWNGLTNEFHPTQMLADLLTIREHFGKVEGIKLTYMGDARYNMGNSWMVTCAKMGMHFTACTTPKYFPDPALVEECKKIAATTGATITLTDSVEEGTRTSRVTTLCTCSPMQGIPSAHSIGYAASSASPTIRRNTASAVMKMSVSFQRGTFFQLWALLRFARVIRIILLILLCSKRLPLN